MHAETKHFLASVVAGLDARGCRGASTGAECSRREEPLAGRADAETRLGPARCRAETGPALTRRRGVAGRGACSYRCRPSATRARWGRRQRLVKQGFRTIVRNLSHRAGAFASGLPMPTRGRPSSPRRGGRPTVPRRRQGRPFWPGLARLGRRGSRYRVGGAGRQHSSGTPEQLFRASLGRPLALEFRTIVRKPFLIGPARASGSVPRCRCETEAEAGPPTARLSAALSTRAVPATVPTRHCRRVGPGGRCRDWAGLRRLVAVAGRADAETTPGGGPLGAGCGRLQVVAGFSV